MSEGIAASLFVTLVVVVSFVGAFQLHTAEGRAKWAHERRISRETAKYIRMGMTPEHAKAAAQIDAHRSSLDMLQAFQEANQ